MSSTTTPYPAAMPDQGGRYDAVWRAVHWTIVGLLILQYGSKFLSGSVLSEDVANAWHNAVGPTILVLMLARLAWRLTHTAPPPPVDLSRPLQILSRATHWAFYAILIGLPIGGWIAANGFGATPYVFGLIPLPALIGKDKPTAEAIGAVHGTFAALLLAVIALHIAGALYHVLVKKDGVIRRMWPV